MIFATVLSLIYFVTVLVPTTPRIPLWDSIPILSDQGPAIKACDNVCEDLPDDDMEPICMMFSRYKKGYQFLFNLCHARKAICRENLFLYIVHANRCLISNQYFLPIVRNQ